MAGEQTREFPLGVVLSLTTPMMLVGDFGDIHEFVEFMAGEPVWTHQIPRVAGEIKPVILRQHPGLAEVVEPELDRDGDIKAQIEAFVAKQAERFGETLSITAMHVEEHEPKDPLVEIVEMRSRS